MKIRRLVALVAMLCLLVCALPPVRSNAEVIVSGPCGDGVTATVDDTGTLTISGNGAMYDGMLDPYPVSREDIKRIVIEPGVQYIGAGAFAFYQYLEEITIPDTVQAIGYGALAYVFELRDVYYNNTFANWKATEAFAETFDRGYTLHCTDSVHEMYGFWTEWSLDDQGNLTIWGEGPMMERDDWSGIHSPWDDKKDLIRNVVIQDGVTSVGGGAFFVCENLQSVTIPESVTSIGEDAFFDCKSMSAIRISGNVNTIAANAFWGCSSLTTVEYSGTFEMWKSQEIHDDAFAYAFDLLCVDETYQMCGTKASWTMDSAGTVYITGEGVIKGAGWKGNASDITSVSIAPGLTGIGNFAFENCSALVSVEIPDTVTLFDWYAFLNCSSLTAIRIPDGITSIGSGAFSGCSSLVSVTLPDSVTEIGASVFASCSSLESISLPDGVTIIDDGTFRECTSLKNVDLPKQLKEIRLRAFQQCTSLKNIVLPDGLQTIGISAFGDCKGLQEITIPDSVTTIGGSAFQWCDSLSNIQYGGTLSQWMAANIADVTFEKPYVLRCTDGAYQMCGASARWTLSPDGHLEIFGSGVVNGYNWAGNCLDIKKVTIYEGITGIGSECFSDCRYMQEIYIPETVTEIGGYAFEYCSGLEEVTLPTGLETIESGTFMGCNSLKTVVIPKSVTNIGWYAFASCDEDLAVYYTGSASGWSDITFGERVGPVETAPVQYNHVHTWQNATCTEPKTCTVCGAHSGYANGHKWDTTTCTVARTCTVCKETAAVGEHNYQKGICTVCGAKSVVKFEFATMRMQLKNELQADFAFVTANLADPTGCYAVVTQQLEGDVTRQTVIDNSDWYKEGSYTVIPYTNIAAKEMTDRLTIVLYDAAGQALSNPYSSTLVDYAGRAFNQAEAKGDTEAMDMYMNMLFYGAAAQVAFNYKADYTATDAMSTSMKFHYYDVGRSTVDLSEKEQSTGSGATGGLLGSRAILESNIQLQLGFDPGIYGTGCTASYSYVNHEGKTIEGSLPIELMPDGSRAVVTVNELVIADCSQLVTIRIYNAKGARVIKVFDSVENFAIRMVGSTTAKPAQKILAQEILNFSTSAYNYFH